MPHLFAWKEEMLPKVKNKQDGVNAIKGWVAGKKFLLRTTLSIFAKTFQWHNAFLHWCNNESGLVQILRFFTLKLCYLSFCVNPIQVLIRCSVTAAGVFVDGHFLINPFSWWKWCSNNCTIPMDGLVDQLDYLDVDDPHQSSFLFNVHQLYRVSQKRYAAGASN